MKTIEFKDLDGNEISLSHSSLATQEAYRIYLDGEQFTKKEINGDIIPICLHLNISQVKILIAGLEDLINDNSN